MLTIAKLGHGRVDYYLDTVAKGIEDYYAGAGEAPGTWRGAAVEALGLAGEVDGDTLRAILGGRLPGYDVPLPGGGQRRIPGWDLTFSAPKSVSVLFGLADPDVAHHVTAAHEAALDESVAYLERWALGSRRRQAGEIVTEPGQGMIVAAFRHRTSRAGDPQLHTHALMANAVERPDGSWGAVDSRIIYRQARSAGFVYQAVLRSQLTERLGVRWSDVDKRGIAELVDIPIPVRTLFSKRRQQIEAVLEARGASSRAAAQIAALRTRVSKSEVAGTDVLRARWRHEAADLGLDTDEIDRVVDALPPVDVRELVSVRDQRLTNDHLLGRNGLTAHRTTYQRGDLSQAWCQAVNPHTVGITAATIDTLVHTTITDRRNVLLGADDPIGGLDRRRWSSQDLLDVEAHILELIDYGRRAGIGIAPQDMVEHALAGHQTLSDEQQRMVEALTRAGHRIDAVIGVAGSGKTYALSVAHQLWTDSGHRVLGATISKQAANQLQADSGITSGTLDSLLLHLRQADARLAPDTVLVVDEAGMVPTRKLAELIDHCPPDIKVVLVGDHDQLPEIGAGGVLRAFAERHDVATLEQNRRQHDPDERAALAEVRNGDLDAGLDWYVQAGRVATFDDALSAREALIDAWWADHSAGCDQLIMAERRTDVDRLNQLARRRRAREGELDLVAVVAAGGRDFAIGDRVIFERNDQRMGVANAQRGTVTGLDHRTGGVTVDVDGRAVEVDSDYLEASDLNCGYSATVHKNQGTTCDQGYVLTSDRTYREMGYVALSRGRDGNRIWTVTDHEPEPTDNVAHGAELGDDSDPLAELRFGMRRSAAHQLAIDHAEELQPGLDL